MPNVKSSIFFSRSQQRGDSENISMVKQPFYDWIIGDFHSCLPCALRRRLCRYFSADAEIPAGWRQKLGGDERFYYIAFSTRNSWQWKEI